MQYLKQIRGNLEAEKPSVLTSRWLPVAGWFVGVAFFLVLFQFQDRLPNLLYTFLATSAGVVAGVLALWRVCASKWPYIRPHIDPSSVAQRVRELES